MLQEEMDLLNEPYENNEELNQHQRFDSRIGSCVPSAIALAKAILDDLDPANLGIGWWGHLPPQERILIGDYLYQSTVGISVNLSEGRLHYFEWLDALDRSNNRIADGILLNEQGRPYFKHPRATCAMDDLPNRLERLHLAGFFRAVGSSLDCLGAAIIGVLGLKSSLRYADLAAAENRLARLELNEEPGTRLQLDFFGRYVAKRRAAGPEDWLEWTNQYRNMFVHRGRRALYNEIVPREHLFYDVRGNLIPRATSISHLARYPDRSEIEALVKARDVFLGERGETTLTGVFESCQNLQEQACEELIAVWNQRRANPDLILQPIDQWQVKIKTNSFPGYEPKDSIVADQVTLHESLANRMLCAAVDDAHRALWDGSPWAQ